MGSSSTRKQNDTLVLRRPKGAGVGGGYKSDQNDPDEELDLNKLCIPSFDVELIKKSIIKERATLAVTEDKIFLGNEIVGTLSQAQKDMINQCGAHGLKYRGVVILYQNKFYGRFIRYE